MSITRKEFDALPEGAVVEWTSGDVWYNYQRDEKGWRVIDGVDLSEEDRDFIGEDDYMSLDMFLDRYTVKSETANV